MKTETNSDAGSGCPAATCSPWGAAVRLARHPIHDLEWLELGQELLPYLRDRENFTDGALRILADRVEWLENQWEESKELLHAVARGDVDSRLRQDRDLWKRKFHEANTQTEGPAESGPSNPIKTHE